MAEVGGKGGDNVRDEEGGHVREGAGEYGRYACRVKATLGCRASKRRVALGRIVGAERTGC
jgi:hypothetical protein